MTLPLIAVTPDLDDTRLKLRRGYGARIAAAGGLPVILDPETPDPARVLDQVHGIVFSGGDDPSMETWGTATHPKVTPIDPQRQQFELELLDALAARPELPVLGICLGMQMLCLARGGTLDQYLPDTLPTAEDHWGRTPHRVDGAIGSGTVHSHHRQAIVDPGSLDVVGRAPDGVIEAVADPTRPFCVGVQWHPERTDDPVLGQGMFERLVDAARTGHRAVATRG